MSKYKDKEGEVLFSLGGQWVSWVHTLVAYTAFASALIVGISLHYHKIVKNEHYGYPDEWFPSVSATIGDRYPERSFFMIFIAITSGPRFALVGLWYLLTRKPGSRLPGAIALTGVFRTLSCGGWTYITSTDDHDWHDILMISYIVATLPWTTGCIALSPANPRAIQLRKYFAGAFFGTLVPLIYFFIQHKVHKVAGAYTTYAFFEWSLIILDIGFDAITALDFSSFEIVVKDNSGLSKGENRSSVPSAVLEKEKEKATAGVYSAGFTFTQTFDTIASVYHGFIFWTTLTSLGVVVWFFPLWYMGISGFEAFIMTTISPLFLANGNLRSFAMHNQRTIHLLSLSGIASYLIPNPTVRLCVLGFGVFMSCFSWTATLVAESVHEVRFESKVLGLMAGLILSSTAKFIWQTNNPVWPIMHAENGGWNGVGLGLAVLAVLNFSRKAPLTTGSNDKQEKGSPMLAAFGIGGLLFGLHSLLSDTSTMILWVWEGFPIRGPYSSTHGWCTVAAMTVGLFAGVARPQVAGGYLAFVAGASGAMVLTFYSHWTGYLGALAIAIYLMAVSVPLLSSAVRKSPAVSFGVGFLLYNFLVLFHVWVVAYAFVPGGPLVRERTDWVQMTMMAFIGLGVVNYNRTVPRRQESKTKRQAASQHKKYFGVATLAVNIVFLCAAYRRFPTNDYKPYHPEDRVMTAGIWTIHFSLDNHMWSSEYRMRDLIKDAELDVVGLMESDQQRIIMGNRDSTQFLAEDLGMYVDYGPGPNKHTWGAALLSKFPIINSTHHLLPSPVGELAPAIHATLDVYGQLTDVFVFHSGQEEDKEDRRLQSEYLAELMGSTDRPSILLSYLVTKPLKGNYNTYVSDKSGMNDVDPSDKDRWCEYILFKGLKRIGYARLSRDSITDTELQVAKFVVPKDADEVMQQKALSAEERNRRVTENQVPKGWRFPTMFRGKGVRGHRYHVFKKPRYYN